MIGWDYFLIPLSPLPPPQTTDSPVSGPANFLNILTNIYLYVSRYW